MTCLYSCTPILKAKRIKKERKRKHPQLIIHSHHRLHLLQYSNCASDLSGRSIESSASYQPMWTESFISTNTACQLTRHNFTPPLNPCVCECVMVHFFFFKCVGRDEVNGSNLAASLYVWMKRVNLFFKAGIKRHTM